jgi:hypothetical protein
MTKKLEHISSLVKEMYEQPLRDQLNHGYLFGGYRDNDEPTEEERARWRRRRENENAFWAAQEKKHADNPIMQLHCRNETTFGGTCEGCDYGGYEGESPEWPCRTVRLVCTGDPDFEFKDDNVIDS